MANLPGCFPAWQPYSTYASATIVSYNTLTNSTLNTYKKFNYQCREPPLDEFCGQVGFQPGLNGDAGAWNLVWTQLSECSGAATLDPPTSSPTLPLWDGVGCPDLYETHTIYHENDRVIGADGYVYQCKVYPYSGSCGQQGFEPGESSSSWSVAWDRLGSCEGTIAPTSSPNYNLNVVGGCPGEYTKEGVYDEGDMVSLNGIVYKCNPFPFSAWCSHDDYAPDSKAGGDAWEVLGLCEGTMAPTSSPNFDTLGDVAGCPGAWDESVDYEGGEKVTLFIEEGRGVVYDCASDWPDSGYCNLIPPGHPSELGWTLLGSCSGTVAPTTSPVFVDLLDTAGCPQEYSSSSTYEPGDKVASYIDDERAVVWECSAHPLAPLCNQYSPTEDTQGGWRKIGSCSGTVAPTSSPNFVSLEIGDGCPEEYSPSTSYEIGDIVTAVASENPLRQMVYECKSPYCNAGQVYGPGSANTDLGWILKGHCVGTFSPTASPSTYSGPCTYNNGTATITINSWSESSLSTYSAGTRVRKGNDVFQCRGYPRYLYCRMAKYEPLIGDRWGDAWMRFGTCT